MTNREFALSVWDSDNYVLKRYVNKFNELRFLIHNKDNSGVIYGVDVMFWPNGIYYEATPYSEARNFYYTQLQYETIETTKCSFWKAYLGLHD